MLKLLMVDLYKACIYPGHGCGAGCIKLTPDDDFDLWDMTDHEMDDLRDKVDEGGAVYTDGCDTGDDQERLQE